MSNRTQIQQLEYVFQQASDSASLANKQLITDLLAYLNRLVSQWELKAEHQTAQNLLSQISEQWFATWENEAIHALHHTLYGRSEKGLEHAYRALNLLKENKKAIHADLDFRWTIHLSLAHTYTLSGYYVLAEHHLKQVQVPREYPHLKRHTHNLQRLIYDGSVKPQNWQSSLQRHLNHWGLNLQNSGHALLHASPQKAWRGLLVATAILKLYWLEINKASKSELVSQCNQIQTQAYLSSVMIHAVHLEVNYLHWASALVRLKRGIRRLPSQPLLWYELSHVYTILGSPSKSLNALEKAVHLMPSLSMAQLELGLAYAEENRVAEAVEHYLLAYLHAKRPESKRKIAFVLGNLLESPQCIENTLREAHPSMWALLSAEIALFLKWEQEDPPTLATLSHLAKLANALEQYELAMALCYLMMNTEGMKNPQCVINLAYTAWQCERFNESVYYYEQALVLEPDNAVAHNNLGLIYFDHFKNDVLALQHFQEAVKYNPNYATAHFNLGRVLSSREALGEAAKAFSLAKLSNVMSQELDNDEINYYLNQIFNQM